MCEILAKNDIKQFMDTLPAVASIPWEIHKNNSQY